MPQSYKKSTLCWDCQRAAGNNKCSWARSFTPVEGWTAKPTVIFTGERRAQETESYRVIKCPEFIPDEGYRIAGKKPPKQDDAKTARRKIVQAKAKKPIAQYNSDGDLVAVYPTAGEARKQNNLPKNTSFYHSHYQNTKIYGYYWQYVEGEPLKHIPIKKIVQMDGDKVIAKFKTGAEAARSIGVATSTINNAVSDCVKAAGYSWTIICE